MPSLDQLNSEFAIANVIAFTTGSGGLTKAVIATPLATVEAYLHGAHVTHFQPTGQAPVLFMSGKSNFAAEKAIRGGVPICFPWFGGLEGHPQAPAHGFARTSEWSVIRTSQRSGGGAGIEFSLEKPADPKSPWPHAFKASYSVSINIGPTLSMELKIQNVSEMPFSFEEALHSYFHVSDVKQVSVTGLANTAYLDKLQAGRQITEAAEPIRISGETDRVYLDTTTTCEIADPGLDRKIVVTKDGSNATVLWNPWIAKAKAMADFGDEEWPGMLCIETCNVGRSAVTLGPGESHIMTAEITVNS